MIIRNIECNNIIDTQGYLQDYYGCSNIFYASFCTTFEITREYEELV